MFITNPEGSIPVLISITRTFGSLLGYKINFDKSLAMSIGYGKDIPNLPDFSFSWSTLGFYKIINNYIFMQYLKVSEIIFYFPKKKTNERDRDFSRVIWQGKKAILSINILDIFHFSLILRE